MGIIMGIISFFFGFFINLLDAAVSEFLNVFGFSMSTFYAIFPIAEQLNYVFTAMGLAFLMVGLIWNGLKGLGVILGAEVENPVYIVGKVAIVWFAVVNSTEILDILITFFQEILLAIKNAPGDSLDAGGMISNLASSALLAEPTGLLGIVYLICVLVLGCKFVKFLMEILERYIVFCFIYFISPCFVATAAFKTTKVIADTFLRAFMGQSMILILNMWCCRLFFSFCKTINSAFIVVTTSDGVAIPAFIVFFVGLAFLNFSMRIDTFLRILGLNTAHTGATMVGGLGFAVRQAASSMAMQKIKSSSQNALSMLGIGGKDASSGASSGASGSSGVGGAGGTPGASGGAGSITGTDSAAASSSTTGKNSKSTTNMEGTADKSEATGTHTDGAAQNVPTGGKGQDPQNAGQQIPGQPSDQQASGQQPHIRTPGDGLRGQSRIAVAEGSLQSLYGKQGNMDSKNGYGATNALPNVRDKQTYVKGGMSASMGRQQQIADQNMGKASVGGQMKQDQITAEGVRAAATSAEKYPGTDTPIASFVGAEAAAAMNGVLAFGNDNVAGFSYSQDEDGNNYISGMNYANGDSVTFDKLEGGIATGEYHDAASGERTGFTMVHDNAAKSMEEGLGNSSGVKFDPSASAGRIGDGSGKSGYHVVPNNPNQADSLIPFIQNNNTPEKKVSTFSENFLDRQERMAKGSVPRMYGPRSDRNTR